MSLMKILIINQPLNNRGDESAHKALMRSLSKSMIDVEFSVLFVGANSDSINQFKVINDKINYINIKPFKGFSKIFKFASYYKLFLLWQIHPTTRKVWNIIKCNDAVICAPGGICMGGFQDWIHIAYLYMAKRQKKNIIYYGRSFGPFPIATKSNKRFKEISIELLHYFKAITIRDKETEKLAFLLNLEYKATVDTAFLDSTIAVVPEKIKSTIGERYMVFVPNLLIWHYKYKEVKKEEIVDFYVKIMRIILSSNLNIVMLPQTFNCSNSFGDDINFFYELEKKVASDKVIVVPDIYSSDIQQKIISDAQYVIGARYHSVVFAINNNVPFIALSYEHKIVGLLETLNKERCMIEINADILKDKGKSNDAIHRLEMMLPTLTKDENIQSLAKNKAMEGFDFVLDMLNKNGSLQ